MEGTPEARSGPLQLFLRGRRTLAAIGTVFVLVGFVLGLARSAHAAASASADDPERTLLEEAHEADRLRLGALVADPFTLSEVRGRFDERVAALEVGLAGAHGTSAALEKSIAALSAFRVNARRQLDALDDGRFADAYQIASLDATASADELFAALKPLGAARRPARSSFTPMLLFGLGGAAIGLAGISAVVVRRRRRELQRDLGRTLAESMHDLVAFSDHEGVVRWASAAATAVMPGLIADAHVRDVLAEIEPKVFDEAVRGVVDTGTSRRLQWVRRDHGVEQVLEVRLTRCLRPNAGVLWTFEDVSDQRRLQEELRQKAFHDTLTGLPNRSLFRDRASVALARVSRSSSNVSVLFIDLDGFKNINDSLGHEAGDELIIEMGNRLRTLLRPSDTLARLGGDEFAVIIEDPRPKLADVLANRMLDAVRQPVRLRGREVFVSASIGIAEARPDTTVEEILRNADTAMYAAKERGKNRIDRFHSLMFQEVNERLELDGELRRAVELNQLRLYFQPIVDLSDGRMHGVEALLRWFHPQRGVIPPDVFIPLAEESGSIIEIGAWVVAEAIREAARLPKELELSMHINVSARQLADDSLLGLLAGELQRTGLRPELVTLEITESVLVGDLDSAIRRLTEFRDLGVELAIDDFGTGYSSLSYLNRLPVTSVKIDRSFISDKPSRRELESDSFVRAILDLAKTLGFSTVAEGVESDEQVSWLKEQGCTFGQGYFFARPLPAESLQFAAEDAARTDDDELSGPAVPAGVR